jgi:hypothetical protein
MRMTWSPRMKILMPLTRRKAAKAKVLKVKAAPKLKPTKAPNQECDEETCEDHQVGGAQGCENDGRGNEGGNPPPRP